jgi:hypothetical protein
MFSGLMVSLSVKVVGTTIEGQGEWDPPGGWRPFRVDLRTGVETG